MTCVFRCSIFPEGATPYQKATLISAVMLIDFLCTCSSAGEAGVAWSPMVAAYIRGTTFLCADFEKRKPNQQNQRM